MCRHHNAEGATTNKPLTGAWSNQTYLVNTDNKEKPGD